jgi:hypothetical protein
MQPTREGFSFYYILPRSTLISKFVEEIRFVVWRIFRGINCLKDEYFDRHFNALSQGRAFPSLKLGKTESAGFVQRTTLESEQIQNFVWRLESDQVSALV